jgi:sugar transferase (PEP-CTERM/EpsH1 system associated)
MNVLYIVPYAPNLVRVRPYNLIRELTRRGNRVSVATLWTGEAEREDMRQLAQQVELVESSPLPRWRSYLNCLSALPTQTPLQAVYCWQPDLANGLSRMLGEQALLGDIDVVHVEHMRGAKYGLWVKKQAPSIPVVWDSVDCISLLFQQAAGRSRRIVNRWISTFELSRNRRFEGWLVNQFDHTLVTSLIDKQALEQLSQNGHPPEISVLPNGVDHHYFQPGEFAARKSDTLVISGKMSYHANVTMVVNFVNDVLPLIQAKRPQVELWIVGKDPAREIVALSERPGITITGTVKDIRPFLQQAAVAVAPVIYGVGIQNKVLEAMACATPVVSTPQAVSALSVQSGKEVLIGESSSELAAQVINLLADVQLQQQIGHAGSEYVKRHHDWSAIAGTLEGIYDETIVRYPSDHSWERNPGRSG